MIASFHEFTFNFNFPAYTSRGILFERKVWFLVLKNEDKIAIGECAPINGLSGEDIGKIPKILHYLCKNINNKQSIQRLELINYPSVDFALSAALMQLKNSETGILFPSSFTSGKEGILINGLIWAGDKEYVLKQIDEKLKLKSPCIKIKVGVLSFEEEFELLQEIRQKYPTLEIRLDANGAYSVNKALSYLKKLSVLNIHSIEQPIKTGQWDDLKEICLHSPIPIVLDEELIYTNTFEAKKKLLEKVRPNYIILKPTLLGNFQTLEQWIELAEIYKIRWWVTSALESNIGLNAIAQWTYTVAPNQIHGLGTGLIYKNNIPSPLYFDKGKLFYNTLIKWNFSNIFYE